MQNVKSLAKAVSKEMADSLKGTEELLTLALTKAQKDNNTVYLERVPPFAGVCVVFVGVCVWVRLWVRLQERGGIVWGRGVGEGRAAKTMGSHKTQPGMLVCCVVT